jgi:hypothetical protein
MHRQLAIVEGLRLSRSPLTVDPGRVPSGLRLVADLEQSVV